MRPGLPGMQMNTTIFRPATFIELALDHLTKALLLGVLLVVLILAAFLFEWRTAFISLIAIPSPCSRPCSCSSRAAPPSM